MSTAVTSPEHSVSTEASAQRRSKARRKPARWPLALIVVIAAGAVGLWSWSGPAGGAISAPELFHVAPRSFPVLLREKGELKAAESVDVKSQVEGRSTIIWLIEEGTQVKKGDLLVRLASDQIDDKVRSEEIKAANAQAAVAAAEKEHEILLDQNASDIRKASLDLDMAKLELQKYLEGDWKQTQLDVELELQRARKVLDRAQVELDVSRRLHDKDFITEGDLYRDELAALEAKIAVEKAKVNKNTVETYTHPKELTQREADVEEAQKELERVRKSAAAKEAKSAAELEAKRAEMELTNARLAKFKQQQSACEIRAPQEGLVVYDTGGHRWDRRQISEGAEVFERQTIIKLPDPSVMVVTLRVHEAKTDRVHVGQSAVVEVEGIPGQVFTGKVTKIATVADSQNMWLNPDLKEYETEITLDPTDAPLKPGVTARADIIVSELDDVLAVPVQAVFTKSGHHFVFLGNGGDVEPAEVEVGMSSDEFVEIKDGISAGDDVLLAVSESLRQTLPEVEPAAGTPRAGRPPGAAGNARGRGAGQRGGDHGRREGRRPQGHGSGQQGAAGPQGAGRRPQTGEQKPSAGKTAEGGGKKPASGKGGKQEAGGKSAPKPSGAGQKKSG